MQYAIVTDLNRCVGCLACVVACKVANGVQPGDYWNKINRVGPYPDYDGATFPDVYQYFLPYTCQHCKDPQCVSVCPTGASVKLDDGTVQIDADTCIGCQVCVSACPYGVRYLDDATQTVMKCTMCHDKIERDELPQCVAQCGGRARFFGDLDEGIGSFRGAGRVNKTEEDPSYQAMLDCGCTLDEVARPYTEDEIYTFDDEGNGPSNLFILRGHEWHGVE
jgi:Fe-S-cluster-containing dehydrogenase component